MNLDNKTIFDISPIISDSIAVFPGDTQFSNSFIMSFSTGDSLALSKIISTVHLGAHVDAPSHYHKNGVSIAERNLGFYMGLAQVISVKRQSNHRIHPDDFDCHIQAPRVLFRTGSFPNPNEWNSDFMALSCELIDYLAKKNVCTIGIDTPSVDLADDKGLEVHNRIYTYDMAILEGIVLDGVPDGLYDLIALPLRLQSAEASPVRAILIERTL